MTLRCVTVSFAWVGFAIASAIVETGLARALRAPRPTETLVPASEEELSLVEQRAGRPAP